ncbi:hypothetical protein ACFX13_044778 [Malus domestica]|uniref:uncharacterized protein n=1 Tax=Malus domestica TaxID=3750 RepID=UPI0004989497
MGNCVFKELREAEEMVKVVTYSGGIIELFAPITTNSITNEFPGHAIFHSPDLFAQLPLHNEELHPKELYYLLPLNPYKTPKNHDINANPNDIVCTPYRMSCDNQGKRPADPEVFPRYNSSGVWKVKLVISPEQLSDILSQEARTEALIKSMRIVAKCGTGRNSSVASSDQWSLSSRWNELSS